MAQFLGKDWKKEEILSLVGDPSQIAGARPSLLEGGKSEGVRAVEVYTGSGFQFTLLPGRGMDIPFASYRGNSLAFVSNTGITSPAYYEEPGLRWLRSFFGGLLTTCGITYCGAPCTDEGEPLGLHGRISNAAAEDISISQEWEGEEYTIAVQGRMREAAVMGEHMTLTRRVTTRMGASGFTLNDIVENRGFEAQPLMMLYHFNFGFPLLGPTTEVVGPIASTTARDEEAERDRGVEEALVYPAPIQGYREKCFFHELGGGEETFIGLVNEDVGEGVPLGIVMRYSRKELPFLTEWKMPCRGCYVIGLEPGTVNPMGREHLRTQGELPFLEPQAAYPIRIEFSVLDSRKAIQELKREAASAI